jgi:hypothetical protein
LLTANQSVLFGFLKYAENSLKYANLLKIHYFGLDCGMLEFLKYSIRAVIQRTIVDFPAMLEHGSAKRITVCVPIQTVIRTSRRLDSFFKNLKLKFKNNKPIAADDFFKAYPNTTLMQIWPDGTIKNYWYVPIPAGLPVVCTLSS